MAIPGDSTIVDGRFTNDRAYNVLVAKYQEAGDWAQWAAGIVESKLTAINTKANEFDIDAFITAATDAISAVPTITAGTITYTAPTAPTYAAIPGYTAPDAPTYDVIAYDAPVLGTIVDVAYEAPTAPTLVTPAYNDPGAPTLNAMTYSAPTDPAYDAVAYDAPTLATLTAVPTPTAWDAGTAPDTAVTFTNGDFTHTLLTSLENAISTGLTTQSTGLGTAEAALFARETARQSAARVAAYNEITTQFSSGGWDVPQGAMLAKQTEMNNESNIRLSDSSSQIMAESARLAQSWNQTILTSGTQIVDMLGRIFDSKIMRDFEAAKTSVLLAVEEFKATISVVVANAQLEGQLITAVTNANDGKIRAYSAEISGESARLQALSSLNSSKTSEFTAKVGAATAVLNANAEVNKALLTNYSAEIQAETAVLGATADLNKALSGQYSAEIQAATATMQGAVEANKNVISVFTAEVQGKVAEVSALAESNKSKSSDFTAQVQGAIAPITAIAESNRSIATGYSAAVQGAAADVQAQGEMEKAKATAGDINSRKALGIADITSKFALSNIDAATRKYLGEVQVLQAAAASAAQMTASALNGVNVSSSFGFSGSVNSSYDETKDVISESIVHNL